LAAGARWDVVFLAGGAAGARLVIGVATARSAAVDLDSVALARDAVALARAVLGAGRAVVAERAGRAGGAAVRAAGEAGADGGWRRGGEVVLVVVDGRGAEAGGEFLNGRRAVVGLKDVLCGVWGHWLWGHDLRDGEWATLGDVNGKVAVSAGLSS